MPRKKSIEAAAAAPREMRQTRNRSKLDGAPKLMRGLGDNGKPLDELAPGPENIPYNEVVQRLGQSSSGPNTPASKSSTRTARKRTPKTDVVKAPVGRPKKAISSAEAGPSKLSKTQAQKKDALASKKAVARSQEIEEETEVRLPKKTASSKAAPKQPTKGKCRDEPTQSVRQRGRPNRTMNDDKLGTIEEDFEGDDAENHSPKKGRQPTLPRRPHDKTTRISSQQQPLRESRPMKPRRSQVGYRPSGEETPRGRRGLREGSESPQGSTTSSDHSESRKRRHVADDGEEESGDEKRRRRGNDKSVWKPSEGIKFQDSSVEDDPTDTDDSEMSDD